VFFYNRTGEKKQTMFCAGQTQLNVSKILPVFRCGEMIFTFEIWRMVFYILLLKWKQSLGAQ